MGTNTKVFQVQSGEWHFLIGALRNQLGAPEARPFGSVDSVESTWLARGAAGTSIPRDGIPDQTSANKILATVKQTTAWVEENGPFDGVIGFSQGAALAAMVLARMRSAGPPPFAFALFICARLPYCEESLRAGVVKFLEAGDPNAPPIQIPTAHIVGSKDPGVAYSKAMVELCQDSGRVVMDHGAGHEIPRIPLSIAQDMARAVEQVVANTSLKQ